MKAVSGRELARILERKGWQPLRARGSHFLYARGAERIATAELLDDLHAMDERPWGDWSHRRSMTPHALARQLQPFGIRATKWRDGADTVRGYDRNQFVDAWRRYL